MELPFIKKLIKKKPKFCFDLLKLNRALCCLSWQADPGGV